MGKEGGGGAGGGGGGGGRRRWGRDGEEGKSCDKTKRLAHLLQLLFVEEERRPGLLPGRGRGISGAVEPPARAAGWRTADTPPMSQTPHSTLESEGKGNVREGRSLMTIYYSSYIATPTVSPLPVSVYLRNWFFWY